MYNLCIITLAKLRTTCSWKNGFKKLITRTRSIKKSQKKKKIQKKEKFQKNHKRENTKKKIIK